MAESRPIPKWLSIALNVSGPAGLAVTLMGWVKPTFGILWMSVGLIYVLWEIWPHGRQWVNAMPIISLLTFILVPAGIGASIWFALRSGHPAEKGKESSATTPATPPTLQSLFRTDFANTMKFRDDSAEIQWASGGKLPIAVQTYYDSPGKSRFVGFYIRSSPKTFDACLMLSNEVRWALQNAEKRAVVSGGYRGQMNTASDLTFTGRVLLYHEDFLSITQKAEIIHRYTAKGFDVQFRGPEYLGDQLIAWHHQHDPQPIKPQP